MKKTRHLLLMGIFSLSIGSIASYAQQTSSIEQDPMIQELLVLKAKMTENNRLGDRYKIQLFYGDIKGASETEKDFQQKYSEWPVDMVYEAPNYKVWVGDFRTKLEAERAFIKLKKDFKSALILKP